ncbi:unnamed protein product, partial [Rotaria magnacalcarata]
MHLRIVTTHESLSKASHNNSVITTKCFYAIFPKFIHCQCIRKKWGLN